MKNAVNDVTTAKETNRTDLVKTVTRSEWKIDPGAEAIIGELEKHGHEAYLVGGCVRDLCLGRTPQDWDIATSALPEYVQQIFPRTVATGLRHGTVTVLLESAQGLKHYEVTTYRMDGEYLDGRRPVQVTFGVSLEEDLRRRDFTINAMAFNPRTGLKDFFGGREDLHDKLIRAVGDPEQRFAEDALRMLRAVRFASQLGYDIARGTEQAIVVKSHLLARISKERIRDELMKILLSVHPAKIRDLSRLGLMKYIIPELELGIGFEQQNRHHDKTVYDHTIVVIENTPPDPALRLAALFHDIGKPVSFSMDKHGEGHFYGHQMVGEKMTRVIMVLLKFVRSTIHKVCILVRYHMTRFERLNEKGVKKLINRVGRENLNQLFILQIADILGSRSPQDEDFRGIMDLQLKIEKILNEKQPLTVKDLAINGDELIALGMKPGVKLGQTLKWLLEKVWEDPSLNTKEKLIQEVKKRYRLKSEQKPGENI